MIRTPKGDQVRKRGFPKLDKQNPLVAGFLLLNEEYSQNFFIIIKLSRERCTVRIKWIAVILGLLALSPSLVGVVFSLIVNPIVSKELRNNPDGKEAREAMLLTFAGRTLPVNYLKEGNNRLYRGRWQMVARFCWRRGRRFDVNWRGYLTKVSLSSLRMIRLMSKTFSQG
ncbi:MAG: hypothetical protein ACJ0RQ_02855 [Candidatus Azotimanducaceae bacterium]